jgi:hypothetical protein
VTRKRVRVICEGSVALTYATNSNRGWNLLFKNCRRKNFRTISGFHGEPHHTNMARQVEQLVELWARDRVDVFDPFRESVEPTLDFFVRKALVAGMLKQ